VVLLAYRAAASAAHPKAQLACRKRVRGALRALGSGCVRWLLVGGVVGVGGAAGAQGPVDGAIRGHISAVCGTYPHQHPQHCVAGEVRVKVTSPELGVEREVDADGAGDFLLVRLPPGEYELRATSRGVGEGVEGIAEARLDLEGGDLEEVMLTLGPVGSSAQAGASELGLEAIEAARLALEELPVEGRRWEDLVELDSETNEEPAAAAAGSGSSDDEDDPANRVSAGDGSAATGLSYAGLPSTQGEFSLDGLSGDQSFRAGPRVGERGGEVGGELQPGVGEELSGVAEELLGAVWDGRGDGGGVACGELGAAWECVCAGA
jgi:hypothetical protein